MGNVSIT